jgi:hypothetical protein
LMSVCRMIEEATTAIERTRFVIITIGCFLS